MRRCLVGGFRGCKCVGVGLDSEVGDGSGVCVSLAEGGGESMAGGVEVTVLERMRSAVVRVTVEVVARVWWWWPR